MSAQQPVEDVVDLRGVERIGIGVDPAQLAEDLEPGKRHKVQVGTYLPLYMLALGVTKMQIGVLSSVLIGAKLLSTLVGGYLADRMGRKRVLVIVERLLAGFASLHEQEDEEQRAQLVNLINGLDASTLNDVVRAFTLYFGLVNIAEEAQVPVIVLSDQFIAQRRETLSMLTLDHEVRGRQVPSAGDLREYKRYKETKSGISPMSWPGMKGGEYQTNGLEHTEDGSPTSMHLIHEKMNAKRYRKLRLVRDKYAYYRRYGAEKADLGIICWGSAKGPVKEAVLAANGRGERVAAFVPQLLYPFPTAQFQEFLKSVREVIVIELSYSAQFYKYLQTFLELPEGHTYVYKRSGGKNLTVAEVEDKIQKVLEMGALRREVLV